MKILERIFLDRSNFQLAIKFSNNLYRKIIFFEGRILLWKVHEDDLVLNCKDAKIITNIPFIQ